MKSIAVTALVLSGAAAPGLADTLSIAQNVFSVGNAGEFTATPLTGIAGLVGLPGDLSPTTFETFCIETSEHIQNGNTYAWVMNTGAVNGGSGGQTLPNFDPLDERTAYLYTQFRLGTLAGFDYTPAGRQASSGDLQKAIWFIEGESGGVNNALVALANAAVGNSLWSGIGDVRVLNLYKANGERAQDQLTLVPGPGALALAGLGVLLSARRRRA